MAAASTEGGAGGRWHSSSARLSDPQVHPEGGEAGVGGGEQQRSQPCRYR